ncbi:MAG: metallophosphoesterase [Deltaproteobacteria bacterium]|nr:metallophosphoesterase [Deltaproteobacteria bacterium]
MMGLGLQREVVIVHSSDLHLGADYSADQSRPDTLSVLPEVLAAAAAARADLVILAGDTFENNRLPPPLLERAAGMMSRFNAPIVILPGNHDPLTPDSLYRRGEFASVPNLCVLGLTVGEAALFPALDLEVWGKPHLDYADMSPLSDPRSRSTRWQLAAAHGHYIDGSEEPGRLIASWLIRRDELTATGADYVALGHWNRAARVGDPEIHAYYSGSPDYAGTVNLVRLKPDGTVAVARAPLRALPSRAGVE